MIITRTPLRITLGGGGTDLPSYYERFGGVVLSAAISKHIYISSNPTFTPDYFLKYRPWSGSSGRATSSTRSCARCCSRTNRTVGGDRQHGRHPVRHRSGFLGGVHGRPAAADLRDEA